MQIEFLTQRLIVGCISRDKAAVGVQDYSSGRMRRNVGVDIPGHMVTRVGKMPVHRRFIGVLFSVVKSNGGIEVQ